jgi:hypothetical protein
MPEIDASEAIKVLGIKAPVEIEIRGRHPLVGLAVAGQVEPDRPNTVILYADAIEDAKRRGEDPKYSDLAHVVAHELVHVRQFQDLMHRMPDPFARQLFLSNMYNAQQYFTAYESIPWEAEAYARSAELAPLIKVVE